MIRGRPPANQITLQELIKHYSLTDKQLNSEIEDFDTAKLASCFDDVELYSIAMGLAIAEQDDLNHSEGTQTAMMKCLQIWKAHNPSQATYKALLDIVLRLGKGDTAHQICQQLTPRKYVIIVTHVRVPHGIYWPSIVTQARAQNPNVRVSEAV